MFSKKIITNDYSIINYMDREELKKLYNKPANLRNCLKLELKKCYRA